MKECVECGLECPVAKRMCVCGYSFPKKIKSVEERMPKCKTNVTEQRRQMEAKVHYRSFNGCKCLFLI